MGLTSWIGRFFGRSRTEAAASSSTQAVDYRGFTILPQPVRQGGQFLTAGLIAKDFPEGRKEHRFIRADTHASEEEARNFMVQKAQRLIDELGDRLFGDA